MNKKYLRDYAIAETNGKNRLVYTGPFYRPQMSERAFLRERLLHLVGSVVVAGLYVGMGILGGECTRKVYAGLPYAALSVPALYAWVDAARFLSLKCVLERMHYEGTLTRMVGWCAGAGILSALSGIGGIVYLISARRAAVGDAGFVLLSALLATAAFWDFRRLIKLKNNIIQAPPPTDLNEKS